MLLCHWNTCMWYLEGATKGAEIGVFKVKELSRNQSAVWTVIFNRNSNLSVPTDACTEIVQCRFLGTAIIRN